MASPIVLERKDAPKESTWNAESVFDSWDAWDTEFEDLSASMSVLQKFPGTLTADPANLAEFFKTTSQLVRRLAKLMVYARLSATVDSSDTTARGNIGRISGLFARFNHATAFADPEMQSMGQTLLDWAEQEPSLAIYRQHFDNLLRNVEHTRSAEVEGILGMLQEPFSGTMQTYGELSNSDLKFANAIDSSGTEHHVGQSTITPTGIQSRDREHRRTAWQNFSDGYLSMQNTLASNYLTGIKQQVFLSRVRGYESVLHMRLAPTNTPVEIFHTLMDTFKANISTWHRYWEVKRKILGVDKMHPYDIWAPIVENQPSVSYEESVEWICNALAPLGDNYVAVMRKGCLEDRWVDWAPNVGKRQGAASSYAHGTHPFIFMAFDKSLMGMSVLSHELGHSMHAYLMDQNQPTVYNGNISMTVAETASNFHQALTRAYLIKEKADDTVFQIALIDEAMFNFHRYFYQMPTLARFELEVCTRVEQGKPMTASTLNSIMRDLYAEGYGVTMTDDPERTGITWAQFGHLYAPFYTFQYAVGISAAHALADDILGGKAGAVDNYLSFLSAGGSRYTMDLFNLAGVDMSTPEPVEKAFAVLADLVDRLDKLTS